MTQKWWVFSSNLHNCCIFQFFQIFTPRKRVSVCGLPKWLLNRPELWWKDVLYIKCREKRNCKLRLCLDYKATENRSWFYWSWMFWTRTFIVSCFVVLQERKNVPLHCLVCFYHVKISEAKNVALYLSKEIVNKLRLTWYENAFWKAKLTLLSSRDDEEKRFKIKIAETATQNVLEPVMSVVMTNTFSHHVLKYICSNRAKSLKCFSEQ